MGRQPNGGVVQVWNNDGKGVVEMGAYNSGGAVIVHNKKGDYAVNLGVDDYGNGEVGVWNHKKGSVNSYR